MLDFGLAKSGEIAELTPDSPTMLTVAGMILGTAGYMAPEQARGQVVDKRADIWAFGVVLVRDAHGQRLFEGKTVSDTLAAVIKLEPDLTRRRRRCSGCCGLVCKKIREPAARHSRLAMLLEVHRVDSEGATTAPSRSRFGMAGLAIAAGDCSRWLRLGCSCISVKSRLRYIRRASRFRCRTRATSGATCRSRRMATSWHSPRPGPDGGLWVRDLNSARTAPAAGHAKRRSSFLVPGQPVHWRLAWGISSRKWMWRVGLRRLCASRRLPLARAHGIAKA